MIQKAANNVQGGRATARSLISKLIWLAIALVCAVLTVRMFQRVPLSTADSWYPMSRALDALRQPHSQPIYQALFFGQHVKFQYPPSGLLLLDLVRILGLQTFNAYNTINAFLLAATGIALAVFAIKVLGRPSYRDVLIPLAPIAFFVALRFYPDNLAFILGQIQILLGLFFLLACFALYYDKRFLAGVLLAFAASIKPQFLPFGLLALWQRDFKLLAGFAGTACALFGLAVILYGWDTNLDYLNILRFLSQHGEYHHQNQSINGIMVRFLYKGPLGAIDHDPLGPMYQTWFPPFIPAVYYATLLSSVAMVVIPFLLPSKEITPAARAMIYSLAGTLFTMASPIAWVFHYNVLLPLYLLLLAQMLSQPGSRDKWVKLGLLALSFVMTGYAITPPFIPDNPARNLIDSHVFFGACILVGLALYEILRAPGRQAIVIQGRGPYGA
jgi:hypothetical protein